MFEVRHRLYINTNLNINSQWSQKQNVDFYNLRFSAFAQKKKKKKKVPFSDKINEYISLQFRFSSSHALLLPFPCDFVSIFLLKIRDFLISIMLRRTKFL